MEMKWKEEISLLAINREARAKKRHIETSLIEKQAGLQPQKPTRERPLN